MKKCIFKLLVVLLIVSSISIDAHAQLQWDGYQRVYVPYTETEQYKQDIKDIKDRVEPTVYNRIMQETSGYYYNNFWTGTGWSTEQFKKKPNLVKVTYEVEYHYDSAYEMLELTNQERRNAGVTELKTNDYLMQIAMERAAETAICIGDNHERPDGSDCTTFYSYIIGENWAQCSFNSVNENNWSEARYTIEAWKNSPGHNRNMLSESFTYVGIGAVDGSAVQIFFRDISQIPCYEVGTSHYLDRNRHAYVYDESKRIHLDKMPDTRSQTNYKELYTTYIDPEYVCPISKKNSEIVYKATPGFYLVNQKGICDYSHDGAMRVEDWERSSLKVGYTYDIHYSLVYKPCSQGFKLESLTPDIVSCLPDGRLKALKEGTAQLKFSCGSDYVVYDVKVEPYRIKLDSEFTIDNVTYVVDSDNTVYCKTVDKRAKGKVVIPAVVKLENIPYKVTRIDRMAFYYTTKVNSVEIGSNVTKIGEGAFNGCKKIKKITIKGNKLKSIGRYAFAGTSNKLVIKVPKKKYKAYKKLIKKGKTGYYKTMKIKK